MQTPFVRIGRSFRRVVALSFLVVTLIGCGLGADLNGSPGSAPPTPTLAPAQPLGASADQRARPPASTATPSAPVPLVSPTVATEPASATFSGERALADVRWLASTIGSRPAGSAAERQAADGLASRLSQLGYTVNLQSFPIRTFDDQGSQLTLVEEPSRRIDVQAMRFSPRATVRGRLVNAGLGRPEDLAGKDLRGAIAVIERGEITFSAKVGNVAAGGAVGAIIYNHQPGRFQGTLSEAAPIPAVSTGQEIGEFLTGRLETGSLTGELSVNAGIIETSSQNVVATLPGASDRTITLGAHYDSVPVGPGANDNGSGTATVLELARVLREDPPEFTVRIVLFGAEEIGLLGSQHYVSTLSPAERAAVLAMLNFDMVGVGEEPLVGGSDSLVDVAVDRATQLGEPVGRMGSRTDRSSDHASFIETGMPALFFYRSDDPNYHTAQDRAEYVDAEHLADAGELALDVIRQLAAR